MALTGMLRDHEIMQVCAKQLAAMVLHENANNPSPFIRCCDRIQRIACASSDVSRSRGTDEHVRCG